MLIDDRWVQLEDLDIWNRVTDIGFVATLQPAARLCEFRRQIGVFWLHEARKDFVSRICRVLGSMG